MTCRACRLSFIFLSLFLSFTASLMGFAQATAVRDISGATVAPGDTLTVTVVVTINQNINGLGLDENLPAGWGLTPVDNNGGIYSASETAWLWLQVNAGETRTVLYNVTVPTGTAFGQYAIDGVVKSASPQFENPVTGESVVTVEDQCTYTIDPANRHFNANGGAGTVDVTTNLPSCDWTAQVDVGWITITANGTGPGSKTVHYTVAANSGNQRTGHITIEGKTHTITQDKAPEPCTYSISPTSKHFTKDGGTGAINVTASRSTCTWTAQSDAGWITITSGSSGTGNGTVRYRVAANSGAERTGHITIEGKTHTVTQDRADEPCTYSISPASRHFTKDGGSGTVSVTTSRSDCAWTTQSDSAWIPITSGSSGTGNGTVRYTVALNSGAKRTGHITIEGKTHTVTQDGDGVLSSPVLQTPTDGSTVGNPVQFAWGAVEGAAEYQINIRGDTDIGEDGGYLWATIAETQYSVDLSFVTALPPNNTFHWAVRAFDDYGNPSAWSSTWSFVWNAEPFTHTHTYGAVSGWYMVSVPLNSGTAADLFGTVAYRWNPATARYDRVSTIEPSAGYWVRLPASKVITDTGNQVATDVTIDISTAGWHQISAPWNYPKSAIQVIKGTETKAWTDAVAAGWVRDQIYGYKATDGAYTMPTTISPWYGYWVKALVSGLSLRLRSALRMPPPPAAVLTPTAPKVIAPADLPPMPPAPAAGAVDLVFTNIPNPITDVHTTTFVVTGPMSALVEVIKVQIFDLSGRLVYEREEVGTNFDWHTINNDGEFLANGAYLYKIYALIDGEWVESETRKLAILR